MELVTNCIPGTTNSTSLKINAWYDYKPEPNACYFGIDTNNNLQSDERDLPILIIGVCFYNETAVELRRTLVSLADQVAELQNFAICQVVFVSDGHRQMAKDTKEFFKHIFCSTSEHVTYWDNLMKALDDYCEEVDAANEDERRGTPIENAKKKPPHLTYVIQKISKKHRSRANVNIPGAKDGKYRSLPLSLIIKGLNRRKHNSQEWILDSFAKQAVIHKNENRNNDNNKYIFMSDCGTLYESQCLYRLVKYMEKHPQCVGCTGRQRVMTASEQDDIDEGIISVGKFFRIIQLADYEASYAIYTGAFSAAGCLPVLPGPCAMFRYSGLLSKRKFRALDPLEIELSKEIIGIRPSSSTIDLSSLGYTNEFSESTEIKSPRADIRNQSIFLPYSKQSNDLVEVVVAPSGGNSPQNSSSNLPSQLPLINDSPYQMGDGEDSDSQQIFSITLAGYDRHIESALEHYSHIVATPPEETDLIRENVKLAEDRIPSYAVVTHGKEGAYTTWVDGAVFKFQAETELRPFVLQRRRWINGAFLCYVWSTLSKPHLILESKHNFFRRFLIYLLYLSQLINYLLASISPSIFCAALYLALSSVFNVESYVPIIIIVLYTVIVLFFMWVHRYIVFVKPLFYLLVVANAIGMCLIIAGYIKECVRWNFFPPGIDNAIIQWCTVAIMSMPFIMAIVALDFKSLGYLLISCIPYWLFLPTLVGTFTIYALSRLSDTTWGNRVSAAGSSFKGASQKQVADLQADLSSNASVALVFISVANVIIEILVIYFRSNTWFIVGCIMTIFTTIIVQVLVSFIYFVIKHISFETCRQRGRARV
ncbi:glycosyltransferase [Indivirus ILV1]|uniref:chitin synthase n=1 Tax=Indivirus ILV1 TaxID=1977633 RepID=A0A1V0SD60_9VIRU|nr:glycosyltransferase [Indivirus ILV1]